MAGQSKLTKEQVAANKLLKDAKTPEEKATAEKAVEKANLDAAKAQEEAEKKAQAEKEAKEKKEQEEKLEKSRTIPLLKKTKDNYVPEPGTEQNYHARIEVKAFDGQTGERLSKPQLQIFAPKAFRLFKEQAVGLGYSVDILNDPTGEYPKVGVQPVKKEEKK